MDAESGDDDRDGLTTSSEWSSADIAGRIFSCCRQWSRYVLRLGVAVPASSLLIRMQSESCCKSPTGSEPDFYHSGDIIICFLCTSSGVCIEFLRFCDVI